MLNMVLHAHPLLQEAAQLRDELSREYDRRAAAEIREKQQLDL